MISPSAPFDWKRWLPTTLMDRYLIRQFLLHFVYMVAVLTVIVLVIDIAEKTNKFIEQKLTIGQIVGDYYVNFLPWIINKFAPVCVFLAVIVFTARMSQNTEFVALLSGGTSFYRLLVPYLLTATLLAAASFYFDAYVVPKATHEYLVFNARYFKGPETFQAQNIHRKIDHHSFLYIRSYNQRDKSGYKVTVEERHNRRLARKLSAEIMSWVDSTRQWRLVSLTERRFDHSGESLSHRNQIDTTLKLEPADIHRLENEAESLTQTELNRTIALERDRGSDFIKQLILVRDQRIAFAFAAIILTVIGVAVSSQKRRGGIGRQIGVGLGFTFLYLLLLNTATVALGDVAPTWVAVWMPNLVFAAVAVFLVRIAPK